MIYNLLEACELYRLLNPYLHEPEQDELVDDYVIKLIQKIHEAGDDKIFFEVLAIGTDNLPEDFLELSSDNLVERFTTILRDNKILALKLFMEGIHATDTIR